MSLVARLVVMVLLAVLPGIAVVLWNEAQLGREREQRAGEEAVRLARFVDAELQRLVEGGNAILAAVGATQAVRSRDPDACEATARNVLQDLPQFFGLAAIDREGRVFCWWGRSGTSRRDLPASPGWDTALRERRFVIEGYRLGSRSGRQLLAMSRSFENDAGEPAGVVYVTVDLQWLNDHLGRRDLPEGATIGIADVSGTFLVRQPPGAPGPGDRITRPWLLTATEPGTLTGTGPDGVERIVGYLPPRSTQSGAFVVSVGLARAPLVAAFDRRRTQALLLFGTALGVSLLLTFFGGRALIAEPVRRLAVTAERWRAGDLDARTGLAKAGEGGAGELAGLGRTFDLMADSLQARERALIESDARFRRAIEGADVPIMLHAEDGEILVVSRGLLAATGWAADELCCYEAWAKLAYRDEAQRTIDRVAVRFARGEAIPAVEKTVWTKDGRALTWVWYAAPPERLADGRRYLVAIAADVTLRKTAEETLLRSRERLDLALGAAEVGLWEWNLATGALQWDGAQRKLFGVDETFQPSYAAVLQLLPAEDRERTIRLTEEAASRGDPGFDNAFRVIRPDGEIRWLMGRTVLTRDSEGRVMGARGVNLDITRTRRAEEDLARSRERLELALSAGRMGLWDWDTTTDELFWDKGQRQLYGLDDDEPVTVQSFSASVHPDDHDAQLRRGMDAILSGAAGYEGEFRIRRKDGEIRWILARSVLTRDRDGRVLRQSGVNVDITDRKRAAEAVEAADRRIRDILESSTDGFIGIDRDWRFTYLNRAAEVSTGGAGRDAFLGRNVWELWADLIDTPVEAAYRRVMATGEAQHLEYRHEHPTRGELWYDIQVFPTPDGIGVFFRDIGERKRFERELARLVGEIEAERARFQGIVDSSPAGIMFAKAPVGEIVYANPQVRTILRAPAPMSKDVEHYTEYVGRAADGRPIAADRWPLARALRGESVRDEEIQLRRGDGSWCWTRISAAPLQDGSGAVVVFNDIDAEKRTLEALRESEERLRLALEAGRLGVFYVAPRRKVVVWDEGERRLFGLGDRAPPATIQAFLALVHPDDRPMVRASIRESLADGGDFRREYRLAAPVGRVRWVAERGTVRKDERGRVVAITGVNWDVTDRREAEERQELLMRELDHRVKNVLAVTQVIAQQSGRMATDVESFLAAFSGRIQAMATAHEMLAASQWTGVELEPLARSTLAHWLAETQQRLRLDLDDVLLPPQTAQNLALVLHELATNAVKHGAWSVPQGRVHLEGRHDTSGRLVLTWTETGGPAVAEPIRRGFGSTLLRRALTYAEGGEVRITWEPEGMVWHAVLPLARQPGTPRGREGSTEAIHEGRRLPEGQAS